jgi:hypothetical protein
MGAEKKNKSGIGMIWRRPIHSMPKGISRSGTGRANVGMTVMTIDPPGLQDTVHIPVMAWSPYVVHDLMPPVLLEG